jgi:hypothetical protein
MSDTPTAAPPPWHRAAIAKFFALKSEAAALRGALDAEHNRLLDIRRARRAAETYLQGLRETIAWAPPLQGRQADRDRTHQHVKETEDELERMTMLEEEVQASRDQVFAALGARSGLLNSAGALMVRLRLLSYEETWS